MSINSLENKIVKTINNIITVKELVDKIKGELKKNDLSKSRKNKLRSKLLKQENNLSSLLETQIKINHTDTKKIVKTIKNIITVEELIDKIKGELKKDDLCRSKKNKLESKLLKQENNLKALNKTSNYLSSLLKTQIKINHTDTNENNPFDFSDIKTDNDEIDLGEYLNIIENNIVKFENNDIRKVLEKVTDEYPFILKGELKINDKESSMINAFFSNRDAFIERIEKINEKYDESIPITFTGIVIKYTKSFNKIRRSYYGTGCDSFKKIVEYGGVLCYIPEENECFRKCLELIYKKDFTEKYHDFIKNSKTTKNIMTSAKIQPFCKKYGIDLGVYNINQQDIPPRYVTERRLCLIIHENHFCVIWKTKKTSFTDAIKELEDNFK